MMRSLAAVPPLALALCLAAGPAAHAAGWRPPADAQKAKSGGRNGKPKVQHASWDLPDGAGRVEQTIHHRVVLRRPNTSDPGRPAKIAVNGKPGSIRRRIEWSDGRVEEIEDYVRGVLRGTRVVTSSWQIGGLRFSVSEELVLADKRGPRSGRALHRREASVRDVVTGAELSATVTAGFPDPPDVTISRGGKATGTELSRLRDLVIDVAGTALGELEVARDHPLPRLATASDAR